MNIDVCISAPSLTFGKGGQGARVEGKVVVSLELRCKRGKKRR